jgi:putative phosphoesterase
MRIGIISDIHGNLPALEAVLDDLGPRRLDAVYCLGDLVGYAAFPNQVTIMGNYDDGVGFDRDECGCAYTDPVEKALGDRSLAWTRAEVTADNKAFLRTLATEIRFEADGRRVLLVHGSPRKINEYLFEDRPIASFQRLAASSQADIIVFGHTHRPYTKLVDGVLFVNAGSVGKPKDGDWRAGYVILDPSSDAHPVESIRLPYDVGAAAAAIRASALPDRFAADIERGGAAPPTSA